MTFLWFLGIVFTIFFLTLGIESMIKLHYYEAISEFFAMILALEFSTAELIDKSNIVTTNK